MSLFTGAYYEVLPKDISNDCPLLLYLHIKQVKEKHQFRFFNILLFCKAGKGSLTILLAAFFHFIACISLEDNPAKIEMIIVGVEEGMK